MWSPLPIQVWLLLISLACSQSFLSPQTTCSLLPLDVFQAIGCRSAAASLDLSLPGQQHLAPCLSLDLHSHTARH